MNAGQSDFLLSAFRKTLNNEAITILSLKPLSGGCINNTLKVETSEGSFFIKWRQNAGHMFECEAKGLAILKNANQIPIPHVIGSGNTHQNNYLILEYIEPGPPKPDYWENLGRSLAKLHQNTASRHGLHFNNYIGSLPQKNEWIDSWVNFFTQKRLLPQLQQVTNVAPQKEVETSIQYFLPKLKQLIPEDKPSLLHGDLWSGNVITDTSGYACLIDPAVYYGSREIEIAFTKLFRGFGDGFYKTYHEEYPMEKGYYERIDIYNLYPLLVHANLFGGYYWNRAWQTIQKYL
jgi:protein-ribulosamine 3-kinase